MCVYMDVCVYIYNILFFFLCPFYEPGLYSHNLDLFQEILALFVLLD